MLTRPVRVPKAVGLNAIRNVTLLPAGIFVGDGWLTTVKSVLVCPKSSTIGELVRNRFVTPELVIAKVLVIAAVI